MWNTLSPILISSVVIAAVLSGIVNVIAAIMNNRRLSAIEKTKHTNELVQYRYTKLYGFLEKIGSFERPNSSLYLDSIEDAVMKENGLWLKLSNEYSLIAPLLEKSLQKELDLLRDEIIQYKIKLTTSGELTDNEIIDCLQKMSIYEGLMVKSIKTQLEKLLQEY
jgi:lipopolysaccharide export LptBFGC system permease protein LptF